MNALIVDSSRVCAQLLGDMDGPAFFGGAPSRHAADRARPGVEHHKTSP